MDPANLVETLATGFPVRDRSTLLQEGAVNAVETVVYDREFRVLVSILRDVTEETREKEKKQHNERQTLEVADKVIAHQMKVVQEIALLLGETAAETKIALTKLKESIDNA